IGVELFVGELRPRLTADGFDGNPKDVLPFDDGCARVEEERPVRRKSLQSFANDADRDSLAVAAAAVAVQPLAYIREVRWVRENRVDRAVHTVENVALGHLRVDARE